MYIVTSPAEISCGCLKYGGDLVDVFLHSFKNVWLTI